MITSVRLEGGPHQCDSVTADTTQATLLIGTPAVEYQRTDRTDGRGRPIYRCSLLAPYRVTQNGLVVAECQSALEGMRVVAKVPPLLRWEAYTDSGSLGLFASETEARKAARPHKGHTKKHRIRAVLTKTA